jgi:hypothetical protein
VRLKGFMVCMSIYLILSIISVLTDYLSLSYCGIYLMSKVQMLSFFTPMSYRYLRIINKKSYNKNRTDICYLYYCQ